MGDDFDLFPKRENLDPFSFGKKDKDSRSEKADAGEELFGQEDSNAENLPDLTGMTVDPDSQPPPPSGIPPAETESGRPEGGSELPPFEPPPSMAPPIPDEGGPLGGIFTDAAESEEKTFDEPLMEEPQVEEAKSGKGPRKSPSPFLVIGGALVIIIGLLYGALTFLKRDKPPLPVAVSAPPVSVPVEPPVQAPAPVPETPAAEEAAPAQVPPAPEPVETPADSLVSEPGAVESGQTASVQEEPAPEPEPALVTETESLPYSIQVGALILKSSVAELEKKLQGLGYDPILKKGSTTAMMNMLTVGPFRDVNEARTALSRLKEAGVDSNMRRRDDGGAIINAGSYLLEENANAVMKKIRSLGYPVTLAKREARLPMTFVRVGQYADMDEANKANEELKNKGLEGIVVKLQ